MATNCAGSGIEARVASGHAAHGADLRERRGVKLDVVPAGVEVSQLAGVRHAEFVKGDAVLPRATANFVVAGAAFDPVGAGVAAYEIVAGPAADGVRAIAAQQRVVATVAVDQVGICAAGDRVVAFGAVERRHSDHPDVRRRYGCCALNGCYELRIRPAGTVRVVIKSSGRSVVDDAIICIVSAGRARAGKEPRISGREVARSAKRAEGA